MTSTPKHSVSVAGIVVRDDGRILAVQRRDNAHWEPPGGVLELGETFEEGVRREVAEETGVDVRVERLTGAYKNLPRGIVALVFRCTAVGGDAGESDEAQRVRWLTSIEVEQLMTPAYAVRVFDALSTGAAFRAHDGVKVLSSRAGPS
jgi:ADP-ribose pyrophosphatase YjhB (NUDIX family)